MTSDVKLIEVARLRITTREARKLAEWSCKNRPSAEARTEIAALRKSRRRAEKRLENPQNPRPMTVP